MASGLQDCAAISAGHEPTSWSQPRPVDGRLLTLWSATSILPWLIGLHPDPWPNFYNDLAAAASVVVLAVIVAWYRQALRVDRVALVLAGVACLPLLQAAFGLFMLPSEAPVIALFVLGIACAVVLGRTAQHHWPQVFGAALFGGLAAAALISAVLAFAQVLHLDWGVLLAPVVIGGSRPYANVGQPNELATLLVWGVIGVLWIRVEGRFDNRGAAIAVAILLLAVVITRSRTGWLEVAVLHAVGLVRPACLGLRFRRARWAVCASLVLFVLCIGAWELLIHWQGLAAGLPTTSRFAAEVRPQIWRMFADGILLEPWFGYGWDQGRVLQLRVLAEHCDLKVGFQHAHNFLLDLLAWNGIPIGATLITGIAWWLVFQLRRLQTPSDWLVMLTIIVFMLHASLELPHSKAFFLLPLGLMVGMLNERAGLRSLIAVKPKILTFAALAFMGILTVLVQDFSRIQEDLRSYRVRTAWAGIAPAPPRPKIYLLKALQTALETFRVEPRETMDANSIDLIRRAATRYPTGTSLMLQAKVSTLNSAPDDAAQALTQLCLLLDDRSCGRAESVWDAFKSEYPRSRIIEFPRVVCKKTGGN